MEVRKLGGVSPAISFNGVLWRVSANPAFSTVTGAVNGQDPLFDTVNTARQVYSFRLRDGSPAIDRGGNAGVLLDLDGKSRPVGLPDLGAYEKQ